MAAALTCYNVLAKLATWDNLRSLLRKPCSRRVWHT